MRQERKRRHDKEVVTVGTLEKGKIVETNEEVLTDKDSEFLETFYGSPMTV